MAEIATVALNGYNAVSLFSGAGGSCCGLRMVGFKVLWASEFVAAARDTYRANWLDTMLDERDVREVQPSDILKATGLKRGELDLLEGSPPCASFSTAGKRHKTWGKVKTYSDTQQRSDDLFFEYARLLEGLQPKVFVAENVSGLVKGVAKGYFLEILARLKACGYNVKARLLDAQWLGVPQMRQRIFFVGVRNDLGLEPAFPDPLPYRYSVREALPHILAQADNGGYGGGTMRDEQTRYEVTSLVGGPSAPFDGKRARLSLDERLPTNDGGQGSRGSHSVYLEETDISRYAIGREWDRLNPGEQSDRYFQLVRPDPGLPCPTVTQRGGDNTVASVTHPTERRKFTIAELKRICAFPDDFVLTGSYAAQWERCGRAVPPVMMSHVARTVQEQILDRLASR